MTYINQIASYIAARSPLIMLLTVIALVMVVTAMEYYYIWKQGQRKLKELDSTQIIREMVRSQQKCRCNWLIMCGPCSERMDKAEREAER